MGVDISVDLNSALERYRANRVYNKEAYDELLSRYECAVKRIGVLEVTINELQKKTIPTAEEIKSMKAVLELFGIEKLDNDGIRKLSQIQKLIGRVE